MEKNIWEQQQRIEFMKKREAFILKEARKLVNEEGYQGLSVGRLAELTGFSRATLYKHFANAEDVTMALAIQATAKRLELFERALSFEGRSREKLAVMHYIVLQVYPFHLRNELILQMNKIRARVSEERQKMLSEYEDRTLNLFADLVREAVEAGDLILPEGLNVDQLAFGLWSVNFGGYVLLESDSPAYRNRITESQFTVGKMGTILLDGLGWRPLSHETNYAGRIKSFIQMAFPEIFEAGWQNLRDWAENW